MRDGLPSAPAADHVRAPLTKVRRCANLPRVSGTFTPSAEDFHVEELPAYTPGGEGEHAFLWIEKTNLPADALFAHIGRTFNVARRDIGYAGLKDTRATTRQWLSVPRLAVVPKGEPLPEGWEACAARVNTPQVRLLQGGWHGNKLRCGHLRGNRFTVVLRGNAPGDLERAQQVAERLRTLGVPNYYGAQRFGRDDNTLRQGMALLRGTAKLQKGGGGRGAWLDKLALSAAQSALFNDYLTRRFECGMRDRVMAGDVLQKRASGGLFVSDDAATDQARFEAREVVPAGPMFGPEMKPASFEADALEQEVLALHGLHAEAFTRHKRLTQGTRRAALIWPEDLNVEAEGDTLRLQFGLPSGSYATDVVAEFVDATAADAAADAATSDSA